MLYTYKTISGSAEGIYKEKGSKFLAFAFHVQSEEEIKLKLDHIKKKHHDARHHSYAWKLGTNPPVVRSNDDGEPTNSAGKPILNQIESADLTDTLILVVRYFGGTLLGVGGLIQAYKKAAADAIQNSKIIRCKVMVPVRLHFKYQQMNEVMRVVKDYDIETSDQSFGLSCSMILNISLKHKETVFEKLKLIEGCTWKDLS